MTKTWNFWAMVGITLGIATGVAGDLNLHHTQLALGLSTVMSAVICLFCMLE
mgnify:CR=1 FL=1